jgi:hypothetical protein
MSVDLILTGALASAVASSAKQIFPVLKEYLERKKQGSIEIHDQQIGISHTNEVSPEVVENLRRFLESQNWSSDDSVTLSRKAILQLAPAETERRRLEATPPAEVGAAVLAISPDVVFRDARKRIDLVFKLNLGLAIILAVILLGGIAGAVISAVFFEKAIWALVFGGLSVGDVIGAYALKPLTAINAAIISTQRLEAIHLRLSEQLKACADHSNLNERIKCQTAVWEAIQHDLSTLAVIAV